MIYLYLTVLYGVTIVKQYQAQYPCSTSTLVDTQHIHEQHNVNNNDLHEQHNVNNNDLHEQHNVNYIMIYMNNTM